MPRKMLINATRKQELRAAILNDTVLEQYEVEEASSALVKGNVYKGMVANVEPSLNACFVEFGAHKQGFLSIDDIAPQAWHEPFTGEGRPRIEDVMRRRKPVIVQVTRDEIGSKGAALTTYVSLAGRYVVLMPYDDVRGISRKITDEKERKNLKDAAEKLDVPEACGFIIRTAGIGQTKTALKADLSHLMRIWKRVQKDGKDRRAPALLHAEGDLVSRMLRDHYAPDIDEILIDDAATLERAESYFQAVMPRTKGVIRHYEDRVPLFTRFGLDAQIEQIHSRRVDLPSGGYLIIEPTEALTVVDVNSGKATKERSQEETAYRTNTEAADEVARQLRLRDVGGLVVIDFIDMVSRKHNRDVEKRLKDALKIDKARTYVGRISDNGLCEINRQRLKQALSLRTHRDCPTCGGLGTIPSPEFVATNLLRRVEARAVTGMVAEVRIDLHPELADHVQNSMRRELARLEEEFEIRIFIAGLPGMHRSQENLSWKDRREPLRPREAPPREVAAPEGAPPAEPAEASAGTGERRDWAERRDGDGRRGDAGRGDRRDAERRGDGRREGDRRGGDRRGERRGAEPRGDRPAPGGGPRRPAADDRAPAPPHEANAEGEAAPEGTEEGLAVDLDAARSEPSGDASGLTRSQKRRQRRKRKRQREGGAPVAAGVAPAPGMGPPEGDEDDGEDAEDDASDAGRVATGAAERRRDLGRAGGTDTDRESRQGPAGGRRAALAPGEGRGTDGRDTRGADRAGAGDRGGSGDRGGPGDRGRPGDRRDERGREGRGRDRHGPGGGRRDDRGPGPGRSDRAGSSGRDRGQPAGPGGPRVAPRGGSPGGSDLERPGDPARAAAHAPVESQTSTPAGAVRPPGEAGSPSPTVVPPQQGAPAGSSIPQSVRDAAFGAAIGCARRNGPVLEDLVAASRDAIRRAAGVPAGAPAPFPPAQIAALVEESVRHALARVSRPVAQPTAVPESAAVASSRGAGVGGRPVSSPAEPEAPPATPAPPPPRPRPPGADWMDGAGAPAHGAGASRPAPAGDSGVTPSPVGEPAPGASDVPPAVAAPRSRTRTSGPRTRAPTRPREEAGTGGPPPEASADPAAETPVGPVAGAQTAKAPKTRKPASTPRRPREASAGAVPAAAEPPEAGGDRSTG